MSRTTTLDIPAAADRARARATLRARLRRPGAVLGGCPIGTVPILWNNVDVAELRLGTPATDLLDEAVVDLVLDDGAAAGAADLA